MALPLAVQEPVIAEQVVFHVERRLRSAGELRVRAGDRVDPETIVGTASMGGGRAITLYIAREMGVAPDTIRRYLAKPIGSQFAAGESVARTRRGLRTVSAETPEAGRLTEINEVTGTGTLVPDLGTQELRALVYGEVATVIDNRRVSIKVNGSRLRGTACLGTDAYGPIKVAVDRNDRELTADGISADLKGTVVLGGMTVGAVAIRRLAEVGARAVVVGSIAEGEIRRAVATSGNERPAALFWQVLASSGPLAIELDQIPVTVFVTEGFGRRPMAATLFDFLSQREGQTASVLVSNDGPDGPASPQICFSSAGGTATSAPRPVAISNGVVARLVDPARLGTAVVCRGEPIIQPSAYGLPHYVVEVEQSNGARRLVRLANLEVLKG